MPVRSGTRPSRKTPPEAALAHAAFALHRRRIAGAAGRHGGGHIPDRGGRAQAARSALAPPSGLAGTLSALCASATVVVKQGPFVGPVEVERTSAGGRAGRHCPPPSEN